MGTVTRLIPRSPQGIRFALEHEYAKLAEQGIVPKTRSWPKMQRELRYLYIALAAQQLYESIDFDDPSTWPVIDSDAYVYPGDFDPDDAA